MTEKLFSFDIFQFFNGFISAIDEHFKNIKLFPFDTLQFSK